MAIAYTSLPVYAQKEKILDALLHNQVIVVQSPTGSGKTTQLPVILYEAGFAKNGIIAVTQPRRIAALSTSEFIAKQLGTAYPGLVGYKMRFEDKTDETTKIKIMTDGILLQEMKLDPYMHKYSVVMVDEAHERSLNIDFVLGLLKRILKERSDFKVIISSATINADSFSAYFSACPVVTIATKMFPVSVIYDAPLIPATTATETGTTALLEKISSIVYRVIAEEKNDGGILIFLPGEKIIKDCITRLSALPCARKTKILPLYGRLSKEEQERVFEDFHKQKIIVSTNIAETSVTINDVAVVIDSGLAKLNFYNPKNFTSSLIESAVSKASCNQRKGRAGRTKAGVCYRLYRKKDFDSRAMYTTEEIYRTDLSEVVLRMAELGIKDFYRFDFLSPPNAGGIKSAIETLHLLNALSDKNDLSEIGKLMTRFPLEPRVSRIIVEAIMKYPNVIFETLIAAAFLSANSPFLLPQGYETEARARHHTFRDIYGDFVSYVHIFSRYQESKNREAFCKNNFFDARIMAEIENIEIQLAEIVSDMNIPVLQGGAMSDYLSCVASGMIQFVCIRDGKDMYKTVSAEHIFIHPGSSLFRSAPLYIVAGEIVKTSRIFAMSVSPLTKKIVMSVHPNLLEKLGEKIIDEHSSQAQFQAKESGSDKRKKPKEGEVSLLGKKFEVKKIRGKRTVLFSYAEFMNIVHAAGSENSETAKTVFGKIVFENGDELFENETVSSMIKIAKRIPLVPDAEVKKITKKNFSFPESKKEILDNLRFLFSVAPVKQKSKTLGFLSLCTDGNGTYWFKTAKRFFKAINETLFALEKIIDEKKFGETEKAKISAAYGLANDLLKD